MLGDLFATGIELEQVRESLAACPALTLNAQQLCDLELLLDGLTLPLTGYLGRRAYEGVLSECRLPDGALCGLPISLEVDEAVGQTLTNGDQLSLVDLEGVPLAVLNVEEVWLLPEPSPNNPTLCGIDGPPQTGRRSSSEGAGTMLLGGTITGLELPVRYDFSELRISRRALAHRYSNLGWRRILGFIPDDLLHRTEVEASLRRAEELDAGLVIAPIAGPVGVDEHYYYTRLRCLEHVSRKLPPKRALMRLVELFERGDPDRRMLVRLQILRNLGCTHALVIPSGLSDMVSRHASELGIELIPFAPETPGSATELCEQLQKGLSVSDGITYPEVLRELRRCYPGPKEQGYTVFFTGLSGAGKSTIANALIGALRSIERRRLTLLDGDLVRKHLSSELGFSRADRDLNIQRVGFVAQQVTANGGVAICAAIAPYGVARQRVRDMIEPVGGFIEVYVATPLEVCEQRDRKGLYAKAREGIIKEFTGIDDPYEEPTTSELRIDASSISVGRAAEEILKLLQQKGFLDAPVG